VTISLSATGTRAVLLDIEGTTTPIDFVYKTLFPFARTHAADYLRREGGTPACREAVDQLAREREADIGSGDFDPSGSGDGFTHSDVLEYMIWLMDRDRKSPGLKALQGLIWQEGYQRGELRGEVYVDVPRAFERWRAGGRNIYIYSSGSVLAQQLLFEGSTAGDLARFLNGYFDTAVGAKTSPDSYGVIAARIERPTREILFVSDVIAELDAARAAGVQTVLCVRDSRTPSHSSAHRVAHSLEEISG
jgi:enolase-phosphatase E1